METGFIVWRKAMGLTQMQAAELLVVDVRTIGKYEREGRQPIIHVQFLMALAAKGLFSGASEPWPDNAAEAHRAVDRIIGVVRPTGRVTEGPGTNAPSPVVPQPAPNPGYRLPGPEAPRSGWRQWLGF